MKKLWVLLFLWPLALAAQWQLSNEAEIRVLTCGPYQNELYSAFGHSAVRVYDPANNLDLLFNYGVFDFSQPNFYWNFAQGNLLYKLDVDYYEGFRDRYIADDRYIHEQILDLSSRQKQAYFNFLQSNARPENATYNYNYFYDNCATRIRDGLVQAIGKELVFKKSYKANEAVNEIKTIRDLCDEYLLYQPWGDLGIDFCLGLPMDKRASPWEYMFLPDYLETGLNHAYLKSAYGTKPLVKETVITYQSKVPPEEPGIWQPLTFTLFLLLMGIAVTIYSFRTGRYLMWFDVVLFTLTGLLGWFVVFLWFFTDHKAGDNNLNIIWAIPLHFPLAFFLLKRAVNNFVRIYFFIVTFWYFLVAIFWFMLPQDMHYSLYPLVLLLALRSWLTSRPRAYEYQKVGT